MIQRTASKMPRRRGGAIEHQGSRGEVRALMPEEAAVRKALRRIVSTLENNFHAREDLLQEALIWFWSRARQYPGHRLGWYLQGVRFYLHHVKHSGRSLDSAKRRGAQAAFADKRGSDNRESDEWLDSLDFDEGIMSVVNAHDICSLLEDRLKPTDRTVFRALAEGLAVGEIARRLKISHQSVLRHRQRIAALAIKLGVAPPPT